MKLLPHLHGLLQDSWIPDRCSISAVARGRKHLQANRSLGFCFEVTT